MAQKEEKLTYFDIAFKGMPTVIEECRATPALINNVDEDGRTLLHWATSGKQLTLAKELLDVLFH